MCTDFSSRYFGDCINYVLRGLRPVTGYEIQDSQTEEKRELLLGRDAIFLSDTDYVTRVWWEMKDGESVLEFKVDYDLGVVEIQSGGTSPGGYVAPYSRVGLGGVVSNQAFRRYEIFVMPVANDLLRELKHIVDGFHCWPAFAL